MTPEEEHADEIIVRLQRIMRNNRRIMLLAAIMAFLNAAGMLLTIVLMWKR